MKETLVNKCELFIKNKDIIKETIKLENSYLYPVCADIFVSKQKEVDGEVLRECKKLLESSTSLFSNFRGAVKLPLISMLAVSGQAEEKINQTKDYYAILKRDFSGNQYLALVAMILTDLVPITEIELYSQRGKRIHQLMKKKHPFLTAGEDSVFAILLAFSEKTDEELIDLMEQYYERLKSTFGSGNSLQSLSHVLALAAGEYHDQCEKIINIYEELGRRDKKFGKNYELSVLGALSILSVEVDELIEEVIEADEFLAKQKGYGTFGYGKKTRLMHAAMLVIDEHALNQETSNASFAAITSTLALIAAQQAAMCAVIAASAASSAAASS